MPVPFKDIDPGIRDRLIRSRMVPVFNACGRVGVSPGVARLREHLERATDAFMYEEIDLYQHEAFIRATFPKYDLAAGGDQGAAGTRAVIRAACKPHEDVALLANYYEGNWDGEIDAMAVESITTAMTKESITSDPDSGRAAVIDAADDEYDPNDDDERTDDDAE